MKSSPWVGLAILSLMILPLIGCGGGGGDGWGSVQVQNPPPAAQPTADIHVSNPQIEFGDVVVDHSSDQTVSVQNTGTGTLTLGDITKSGATSAPFSLPYDNCSLQAVAPGGTCTFQIRFSPSGEGVSNAVFSIPSNDPDENPLLLNASGYGRSLYVSLNELKTNSCPKIGVLLNITYKNAPVAGLGITHLTLLENGAQKTIDTFDKLKEPISVALVMDYSDSMSSSDLSYMENSAKSFIDKLNPATAIPDEAAIIKFSTSYEMIVPPGWTTDKDALKTAIDSPFSRGNTALYNALSLAIQETANRGNRRAIIVITDGDNNVPGKTLDEVIAEAKNSGIRIFTIGLGNAVPAVLSQIASETGGQYYSAPTSTDLDTIYLQIAETLVGQYLLEYMSSGASSITLDLRVDFPGLTGRATKAFSGCP
jgi:VWFA-related protein